MGLERINDIRRAKGYTIEELSARSRVPVSTIKKISAGITTNPNLDTVQALVSALGCRLDDLDDNVSTPDFSPFEQKVMAKYRTLDPHGKKLVDMVLNCEYDRVTATTTPSAASPKKDNVVLVAARGGDGVEAYTISDEAAREADEAIARLEKAGVDHEADDL